MSDNKKIRIEIDDVTAQKLRKAADVLTRMAIQLDGNRYVSLFNDDGSLSAAGKKSLSDFEARKKQEKK